MALPPNFTPRLKSLVFTGKIDPNALNQSADVDGEIRALINTLLDEKIISETRHPKLSKPRYCPPPRRDLTDILYYRTDHLGPKIIYDFITCLLRALFYAKLLGFSSTLSRLTKHQKNTTVCTDEERLSELVYNFRRIRPYFYTASDHCYFDCIVIILFLRKYGFDPRWIFSVKTDPFEAHCWVQVGEVMATDTLGATVPFVPILVV
ncbi:MAG TPA: lasso peptide biosynthesis B2 protein [Pedomonas sp.]|uniref:lasso peptide biosynthesis B2 protein n=1 Tax=Pedomonas sp. TaxID=2976421 RepID=UPI002F425436